MEWKSKIDESCADEVEDMIISSVKAGFLSDEEIQEECEEYIEEEYPDDSENISSDDLLKIVKEFRDKFQNTGNQENFFKLDSAFKNMEKHGIIALHCAGYTQSDGFDDCNEIASEYHESGRKVVGCCFYTLQDLEHILHEESISLYLSFGNYFNKPSAEEIGQMIVGELENAGFSTQWNQSSDTKIAIMNLAWDKQYDGDK